MPEYLPDKHCGASRVDRPGWHCTQTKGWGTGHPGIGRCKLHGGATENHNRAAFKEIARRECERLGLPIRIDPGEALIQEVWESAGNVAFYRQLVQELSAYPEPDRYVSAEEAREEADELGVPEDPDEEQGGHWRRGEPGVYGLTYHVSGLPTGEAKPHVLVQMYNDERKHLAAVAAAALKAGVEERRVRIAEDLGERIAEFSRALIAELGLDPSSEPARAAFHKHLTVITGGADGASRQAV